jgi:hypothetical protein
MMLLAQIRHRLESVFSSMKFASPSVGPGNCDAVYAVPLSSAELSREDAVQPAPKLKSSMLKPAAG